MKIETITAHYSRTQSLPGYNNVKPGLSATVALEDGDDVDQVRDDLMAWVKAEVHAQVDEALEADDQPPIFFRGARYALYKLSVSGPGHERLTVAVFIWPSEADKPQPPGGCSLGLYHIKGIFCTNRRLEWLRENCYRIVRSDDLPLFECLDGALSDELLEFARQEKERLEAEDVAQSEGGDEYFEDDEEDESADGDWLDEPPF